MLRKALRATRLILVRPRRAWLMIQVATWAFILSCALKFRSLPAAMRILSVKTPPQNLAGKLDQMEIATAVDAVLGIHLLMFRQICWRRAILLHHFLGREGIPTTIVFGVRLNPGGEVHGHAWLEGDGRVLLEAEPPDYRVTYRFPSDDICKVDLKQIPV